ncbi:hypothetical protein DFH28DRAFT_885686 [Melampsora americana]|nr:hypothetical protein DFH28DRAFT_885686 [Melampsora americana]
MFPTDESQIPESMITYTLALINDLKAHPSEWKVKDIFQTFLVAHDEDSVLDYARRYWGSQRGWPSTLSLLNSIRKVVCKKALGKHYWKEFILAEAKMIVAAEASRRWQAKHLPAHVPVRDLKPSFFSLKRTSTRGEQIKSGFDFLWRLIRHRLSVGKRETNSVFEAVVPREILYSSSSPSNSGSELDNAVRQGWESNEEDDDNESVDMIGDNTEIHHSRQHYARSTDGTDSESSAAMSSRSDSDRGALEEGEGPLEDIRNEDMVAAFLDSTDLDKELLFDRLAGQAYEQRGSRLDRLTTRFDEVGGVYTKLECLFILIITLSGCNNGV